MLYLLLHNDLNNMTRRWKWKCNIRLSSKVHLVRRKWTHLDPEDGMLSTHQDQPRVGKGATGDTIDEITKKSTRF